MWRSRAVLFGRLPGCRRRPKRRTVALFPCDDADPARDDQWHLHRPYAHERQRGATDQVRRVMRAHIEARELHHGGIDQHRDGKPRAPDEQHRDKAGHQQHEKDRQPEHEQDFQNQIE